MADGMATHGIWCNTRTYPTRCRYCGEAVFFFSCSCGCKVFFDALGSPWPEHNCMERWIAELGSDTFGQLMAWRMMQPGVSVGMTIAPEQGARLNGRAASLAALPPMECEPRAGDESDETGVVLEVCPVINLAKQLKIPVDTPMGNALFRALGTTEVGRITIQTGSLEEDENWLFVMYVPRSLMQKQSIVQGDLIRCKLRAVGVLGLPHVWFCDDISGGW